MSMQILIDGYQTIQTSANRPQHRKNWKSFIYLAAIVSTIAWVIVYFSNGFYGYLAAVVVCIGMSLFSIYDFRDIFRLKEQIEGFTDLNGRFKKENKKMEVAVETIESVNRKLKEITQRLTEDNRKLSKNVKSLETLVDKFSSTTTDVKIEQAALMDQCKAWIQEWRTETLKHVRALLLNAYKAIDHKGMDDKEGLCKAEYVALLASLPEDYKCKITSKYKDFDAIDCKLSKAKGQTPDGNIDRHEFCELLDELVK
eukprot:1158322_1